MSVYIISDTHFGHERVTRFRKDFLTSEEHDNFILKNILRYANKRNTLYILGDYIFSEERLEFAKIISESFKNVKLVLGNHCTENKRYRKIILPMIENGWVTSVYGLIKYKNFWLSHAPIHPLQLRGKKNIHGHVHYASLRDKRYINVSAEAINFVPVEVSTLK